MADDDATVQPEDTPPGPVARELEVGPAVPQSPAAPEVLQNPAPPEVPQSSAAPETPNAAAGPAEANAPPAPPTWVAPPAPGYPAPPSLVPDPAYPAPAPAPGGWQAAPQAAPGTWPAMPYPSADPTGWYWCPTHLIASEKEGTCPTCGQPYQPAPPWGIPAGPYRPEVSIYHRGRKEKVAYVVAGLVLTVMALGAVVALTALWRHGTPLDSNGLPVTTNTVASGSASGAVATNSTDTNSSRLVLHSLEGKNLILAGHWTQTTQVYRVMIDLAKSLTTDNTQPPLDVAASKGSSTIAVFNVPTNDPAKTISDHSQAAADSSSDTGGVVNIAASQNVTIDGKASNFTDITSVDTTGKTVLALRIFFIPTANHVVMVAVGTTGPRDDIDTVSQALQTLQ